jgi:hypothetical protein
MVPALRQQYNQQFDPATYERYLEALHAQHPGSLVFRVAETPIFVDRAFTHKMLEACESIVDVMVQPDFRERTAQAIPQGLEVPGENDHPHFIAFDFGICENEQGAYEPMLIEMQGFPSLFCYQVWDEEITSRYFQIPPGYDAYLNGFNKDTYLQYLKDIIIADEHPENVVLLEILPHEQKTRVDFYATEQFLGLSIVCITELIKEGRELFYLKDGRKTKINRVYNRVIFDDLAQQSAEVQEKGRILFEDLDITWVTHPHWFYRISKYTLPLIQHPYVPETRYLHTIETLPADLENYVLKPLFSFAGQGVVIDVTPEDIAGVKDPENWILQQKVKYADAVITPDVPAKAEIRIFYFWKDGEARPVATTNLARLSKGKMIGVRYNKDKEWVGGTLAYFEQ